MVQTYLALGSNLGDRLATIQAAIEKIKTIIGLITAASSIYETEPVGKTDQPYFLNGCIEVSTKLSLQELLAACQEIEKEFGREHKEKWGPRTLDIDILFYDHVVLDTSLLNIPHAQIPNRKFLLIMLFEIAPDLLHPKLKKTVRELLKECQDTSIVRSP